MDASTAFAPPPSGADATALASCVVASSDKPTRALAHPHNAFAASRALNAALNSGLPLSAPTSARVASRRSRSPTPPSSVTRALLPPNDASVASAHNAFEAPLASIRAHSRVDSFARSAATRLAHARSSRLASNRIAPSWACPPPSATRSLDRSFAAAYRATDASNASMTPESRVESRIAVVSALAATATDAGSASGALARAWSAQVARLHSPLARLDPRARSPSSSLVLLASSPPPPPAPLDDAAASAAARSRFRRARAPGSPSGPLAFAAAIATMPPSAPAASASAISGPSRASPASTHRATRSATADAVPFAS